MTGKMSFLDPKKYLLIIPHLFLVPLALASSSIPHGPLVYHEGPLLTGNLELSLLWYGPFGHIQKHVIRSFIESLNHIGSSSLQPHVSSWWKVVESYQAAASGGKGSTKAPPILLTVTKQITDVNYSVGKVLTEDLVKALVQKTEGRRKKKSLVVIFSGRGVKVHGLCSGKCALHGAINDQPYLVVGNPESECPGTCGWPFHQSDHGPKGVTLQPPNGNLGADAMVVSLASGLAEAVTNPFKTGFYVGNPTDPLEAESVCPNTFGTGAFPGYTGKVLVDPHDGGAFNAYGVKGHKYMLPAIWNPKTQSCWTTM